MPTQKVFKQRVRARMTKTGESYTAARRQLIHKAVDASNGSESPAMPDPVRPAAIGPERTATGPEAVVAKPVAPDAPAPARPVEVLVSDEAVRRATGKGHDEWFAILDGWGATERSHPEIARWLKEVQGVPPWWTQNLTVDYERARGRRGRHQMADGFSISVTRTIAADPGRVLAAFSDPVLRRTWLPDAGLTPRQTRAARTARFDWAAPPSRVVVTVGPKAGGKSVVAVAHEQIADALAADELKAAWRTWLGALKDVLEAG